MIESDFDDNLGILIIRAAWLIEEATQFWIGI